MEKKITKFDLNAAFKALDEIEIPASEGLKANISLNESIKPVMKTECLLEDYYDVGSGADLEQAAVEREEEVKAAKLDKIEKIIDLDAKTPDELQPSYVGKTIIQCPQCMTLFYKDPADIVVSEDDPAIVNVAEVCQHCGNTTGYTVIGKVGAPDDVPTNEPAVEEMPVEEVPADEIPVEEIPAEETDLTPIEEVPAEETAEELPEVEETEEEVKEESFTAHTGNVLAEQVETALESLNKSEENAPVEKHELSEHDSENLTLNEEVDLEEGRYGQTYRFYVRHKDGSEPHFDQEGLKYSEIKQICAEEAEPDDVIFVSVYAVDEKGNETPLDKYSIDKYPKVADPADESLVENITTEALTEDVDLDKKLKEHNEYIEYLQKMIAQEEEALKNAKNEEVKAAIQRRLDGFKSDLEEALPEAVKTSVTEEELPEPEEVGVDSENVEEAPVEEVATESLNKSEANAPVEKKHTSENDSENLTLNEEATVEEALVNKEAEEYVDHITTENRTINEEELVYSEEAVDKMLDSKEFEKPISDAEVQTILDDNVDLESYEEVDECALKDCLTESLTNVYENVEAFEVKNCSIEGNKFIVEGIIRFNSGTRKETKYVFTEAKKADTWVKLSGINENLSKNGSFILNCATEGTKIIPETVAYRYTINESLVEGCTEKKINLAEAGFLGIRGGKLDDVVTAASTGAKYVVRAFKRGADGNFEPVVKEDALAIDGDKSATEYNKAEKYATKISKTDKIAYVKIYLAKDFKLGKTTADIKANEVNLISKIANGIVQIDKTKDLISKLKSSEGANKVKGISNLENDSEHGIDGDEGDGGTPKPAPEAEPKPAPEAEPKPAPTPKNTAAVQANRDYAKIKKIAQALGIDGKTLSKEKLVELRKLLA